MGFLRTRGAWLGGSVALLLSACVPASSGQTASASEAAPRTEGGAEPESAPTLAAEGEAAPEPDREANAAPKPKPEPEPEIADSQLHPGLHIEPGDRSGLADFATQLDATLDGKGSLWVGPLEGNGGRDVLIYIPPGADDAAPFELVFHFHGTYSEVIAAQTESMKKHREWVGWERATQTTEAAAELQAGHAYNVAFVYPLSAGKRLEPGHRGWSNVAYDREWMNPISPPDYRDDFAKLYEEVELLLRDHMGLHPSKLPAGVIAEGHSAGGIALLNIALNGSPHVREYIFLDASFQGWADACHEAIQRTHSPAEIVLIVNDKGMADPFEGRDPWCLDMEADAALWKQQRTWCKGQDEAQEVGESGWTCAELDARAQLWADSEKDWCAAFAGGMQDLDGVTLIETTVFHKDMPRRYAGGLGLRDDHSGAADE